MTDDAQIRENIIMAYNSAMMTKYTEGSQAFIDDMTAELEKTYGEGSVTITESNGSYTVAIDGVGTYVIDEDGNVSKAIDAKYIPSATYIVGASADATNDINGEATLTSGSTIYVIVSASVEEGSISSVTPGEGLTLVSSENGKYVFSTTVEGTYTVTVVSNEGADNKYEKEITVKVDGVYEVANKPNYWKVTSSSNQDNEWYLYGTNAEGSAVKVNTPILEGGMKAIKYDNEDDTSEISGSRWANAMTSDGSMWVWIPRFAYKITSGYHTSTAGTIEIAFLDTNNNFLNGESGTLVTEPSDVTYTDTDKVQNEWLLHPAFTSSADNGGGFGEISGFWFAKFETSGSTTAMTSKAAQSSLVSQTIGNFYTYARKQLYGETGSVDSDDGYTSFGNSHMVKNSEWGAVAYLSESKYGTSGVSVANNNSGYIAGGSSEKTVYTTYATRSTTLNAYGIYDMNGGAWEYVASYVNNSSSSYMTNGGAMTESGVIATSTKYKTVYEYKASQSANYEAAASMKGDAVYETSNGYSSSTGSWHAAYASFPDSYPFFRRSGDTGSSSAGVFSFGPYYGGAISSYSCRLALVF